MSDTTATPAPAPEGGGSAATAAATEAEAPARENRRKVREGIVTSNAMDKTAIVTVTSRKPHRLYGKTVQQSTKLYTHDEDNDLKVGDRVRVQETRPLSKLKRWRIVEVVERAR